MEESEFEPEGPLDDKEREALRQDLTDVESLKSLLGPKGIRGSSSTAPTVTRTTSSAGTSCAATSSSS